MKPLAALAAAMAVLSTVPGAAGASTTAQMTIGQFTYTLTDLNPSDGVNPSITFLPAPAIGPSALPGQLMFQYNAGNGTQNFTLDGSGSANYTAQGVTVGGSLSDGPPIGAASLVMHVSTDPSYGQTVSSTAMGNTRWFDFVLSPYTSLTVQANLHYTGEVTASGASNRVTMDGAIWLEGLDANNDFVSERYTAGNGYTSATSPFDRTDTMLGTYSNDSASSFQGELQMYGILDAQSIASAPLPVPEPANVAMLGAGLPLLLALRRRARRRGPA